MMANRIIDIIMPSLGADMTEGTLVEWLVDSGESVHKGDIIAVIETQKGAIDMEVYHSGRITELLQQPVVTLPVGTVLARLHTEAGASQPQAPEPPVPEAPTPPRQARQDTPLTAAPCASRPGVKASPLVRRLAMEHKLDLATLTGSGPGGALLRRDIVGAIGLPGSGSERPSQPAPAAKEPPPMRAAIAAAMARSKREIPHYYLSLDIDIGHSLQWLKDSNASREPEQRILLLALLLKAVAMTLIRYPQLNGYYLDQAFQPRPEVNIGNAISLRQGGLVVPSIQGVDQLPLDEIMALLRDQAERSRSGHLRSSELTEATITVTSMGERGSDAVFGVIYPPQVAIIGFGRPRSIPVVQEARVKASDVLTATLSADHRVSDGILGAKFLHALSQQLQQPESL
ncbi:pyruvate dehydrogenase E2 component (dihydrolipoamide acetyltransferase) [Ferrimonas sediminum]|uniref:Dihydrolipoamide acetyltransferase component of pyruvate dehydrogenase complex n=1 Tax=Ferrimonas sediminum TaxID=718193 RepID=A0A1G8W4W9_9GAMM|nr:dihydrolipoamide acetyltransferase family protein [Ferrimonas sediminum]SDJ73153.1 pyruvate dehydrogenase E2 component (dihydrolipoamide acetyltransferase) [Ferrimonas sediminum]